MFILGIIVGSNQPLQSFLVDLGWSFYIEFERNMFITTTTILQVLGFLDAEHINAFKFFCQIPCWWRQKDHNIMYFWELFNLIKFSFKKQQPKRSNSMPEQAKKMRMAHLIINMLFNFKFHTQETTTKKTTIFLLAQNIA